MIESKGAWNKGKHFVYAKLIGTWCIAGLFLLFQVVACGGGVTEKCLHKEPVPIFEGITGFENHEFEATGTNAVERVDIPEMGLSIELYQSGCNALSQEFRILIHDSYELDTPPAICAAHIANIFRILSEKAPKQLGPLYEWGKLILSNAQEIEYNEPLIIPEMGVSMKITKTHEVDSAILTLELSE